MDNTEKIPRGQRIRRGRFCCPRWKKRKILSSGSFFVLFKSYSYFVGFTIIVVLKLCIGSIAIHDWNFWRALEVEVTCFAHEMPLEPVLPWAGTKLYKIIDLSAFSHSITLTVILPNCIYAKCICELDSWMNG